MHVLVTGGTGFVGQHLVTALHGAGHHVWTMSRSPARQGSHERPVPIPVIADLRDRSKVSAACVGMDVVYHVGALSAPWGRRADFRAINVGGTANVIAGCQAAGVQRLIYVSSPSVVFGGQDQINLTEAAPYPRHFASVYSETKKLAEDCVNAARHAGLNTVILRPKAIFGPGDTTLLPRLIAAARHGRLPQIGNGKNQVDLTYIDNVVQALVLALDAPGAVGHTYHITNDEHPQLWDVIKTVLHRLEIRALRHKLPVAIALGLAHMLEAHARLSGHEPILSRYTVAILARTQTYDTLAARTELGYRPQITVAEGIERTLTHLAGRER